MQGTVKTIVEARGYGFISAPGAARDVFFHATALQGLDFDSLLTGRRVEFEVTTDPKNGRERAAFVKPAR